MSKRTRKKPARKAIKKTKAKKRGAARRPWWDGETAIRIAQIPHHVPPKDDGSFVDRATAYRWTTRGIDGVTIRRYRIGGSWYTTVEEVSRWSERLTKAAGE